MLVRIVTDSNTNVPDDYLQRLDIIEVPSVVTFGQESFLYKVELPLEAVYQRMAASDRLPTTSAPPPQQFLEAYQRAADEGAGEVVAVTVTSKLSGTYNSAVVAAEQAPLPVRVFDTLHVSMAAGWVAIAAGELVQAGLDSSGILAHLEAIRARIHMAFTPANLRYIIASGRVPRLQGMIGDLLNIKPVMSTIDGMLEPVARVRTQRKAQEYMLDLIATELGSRPARVAVGHCNVPDEGAAFAEQVRQRLNVSELVFFDLGMLAALGGPGLLGLGAYSLDPDMEEV
jgi:DegV family protein with EDD domain